MPTHEPRTWQPWTGGRVTATARCVVAPNPGPLTLDGTNTWILGATGAREVLVVDPGPDDEGHLEVVARDVAEAGARVATVLLTHGHLDHSAGARRFSELVGAPVRALDPRWTHGADGLHAGDVVAVDGLAVEVVAAPGHSSDSLAFVLTDEAATDDGRARAVLTGDTVLGRGTSVIAWPDGVLGDYLDTLGRLRVLARERPLGTVLPGHGPPLDDAGPVLDAYLAHRRDRLDQVRQALADGADTAADVVRRVYGPLEPALAAAAERSVEAQLAHLRGS